ncbi:unnamed protein product [Bathycoccus prasinos]
MGKQILVESSMYFGGRLDFDVTREFSARTLDVQHVDRNSPPYTLCLATSSKDKRLPEQHRNIFINAVKTAGSGSSVDIFVDKAFSCLQAVVNSCRHTNTLLRTLQIVGLSADPNTVLVDKSTLKWKKEVLRALYDRNMTEKLSRNMRAKKSFKAITFRRLFSRFTIAIWSRRMFEEIGAL